MDVSKVKRQDLEGLVLYQVNQSPLYKLTSKSKLRALLKVETQRQLSQLTNDLNFKVYRIKKDEKERLIEEPRGLLRGVHNRLAVLLRRVAVPDYLHSGVKKKSNVTNALAHLAHRSESTLVTDISKFYPSSSAESVFRLFKHTFKCSGDVAKLITELCCCDNHVPTGSSLSMTLAFWANKKMFDELLSLAERHAVVMTVYVDDLTFSGRQVNRLFKATVLKIIRNHGLTAHNQKTKLYEAGAPKIITGVVLNNAGVSIRNKHHQQMYSDMLVWEMLRHDGDIPESLFRRLSGRLNSMSVIDHRYRDKSRTLRDEAKKLRLLKV